jgi:glycosyltransferase involved in cell wall biosynthesis
MEKRLRILAVVDYYLPGYKGGGPAVSVSRLVGRLSDRADFSLFTRDRDLGDTEPYEGIQAGEWFQKDGVSHFYARPDQLNVRGMLQAIRHARPDVVYLNSYFSGLTRSALLIKALGLARGVSFVVAPRGEFSPGALAQKARKKSVYLAVAGLLGLHKGLTWQVSSEHEMRDTQAVIGLDAHCYTKAPDLQTTAYPDQSKRPTKQAGIARFAFVSRISPKKNLLGAIRMLDGIRGDVLFTIYGPAEDAAYWAECEQAIAQLPPNVRCDFQGGIPSSEVQDRLSEHHFFLFPTLGENFGHVIPEALFAGCPVLLSDQTPWLDLDEHAAGWVLPLEPTSGWTQRIQACVDMPSEEYERHSQAAKTYIERVASASQNPDASMNLFVGACSTRKNRAA